MEDHRVSAASFSSDLASEFDAMHVREDYELYDISRTSRSEVTSYIGDQEGEHLLNVQKKDNGAGSRLSTSTARSDKSKLGKAQDFLHTYNPVSKDGRQHIRKSITRAGPVTADTQDDEDESQQHGFFAKWQLHGWRFGVFLCLIAVIVCLVVELIMLIIAMALNKPQGDKDGIGILFTGSCDKVQRIDTILAVPLNIIATILMATSNYVMQCLTAPSRKDVDRAHAAGSYLNIGISSVHNLLHNPSLKAVLWISLVLTTIPIHLLLNSAFFGALQANNYGVMVISTGLEESLQSVQEYGGLALPIFAEYNTSLRTLLEDSFLQAMVPLSNSTYLTKEDCFSRYKTQLQNTASNVIVVTKQDSGAYSTLPAFASGVDPEEFLDSYTAFDMPQGAGLYLDPFDGNAVPMLNTSAHWTSGILPANTSGGLYHMQWAVDSYLYNEFNQTVQSVFSSFDYHYWVTIKELGYDFNNSAILRAGQWSPTSWMCDTADVLDAKTCTSGKDPKPPDPWLITPQNFEVDHCLSQTTTEKCHLQYSFPILLIVIGCDIAKIIAMSVTLFMVSDPPLATLGDAIASFLEKPDAYTRGCCLMDQEKALQVCNDSSWYWQPWKWRNRHQYQQANTTFAERLGSTGVLWKEKAARWVSAPSKVRWAFFALLYVGLFVATITVLMLGVRDLHNIGIDNPLSQGFGSINPNAVFTYPATFTTQGSNSTYSITQTNKSQTLFADVLIVNTPQLLFSALYFLYNGLFTTMLTAAEWTSFASVRKALRVSKPKVGQRETYWLQLPWKFSAPLMAVSILVHWLVSRSLFIVRINVFGWDGQDQADRDISACGYSPLAILIVILLVLLFLFVVAYAGWQKLDPGIPMCGTNSVALAAACHYSDEGDEEVTCRPLLWGVTEPAGEDGPGHCSISDEEVKGPVDGMAYI